MRAVVARRLRREATRLCQERAPYDASALGHQVRRKVYRALKRTLRRQHDSLRHGRPLR